MWTKIKLLLGIYNLRDACADKVAEEFGEEAVPDFLQLYDSINSGIPVNIDVSIAVIDIVEKTKKELKQQTLLARMISWISNKKEKQTNARNISHNKSNNV